MRDAVKILFDCAMEVRIPSYLTGNEYKNCTLALRREEKYFLSLLPPEEALRLEEYFADANCHGAQEMEAAFRAGIAVALDLLWS